MHRMSHTKNKATAYRYVNAQKSENEKLQCDIGHNFVMNKRINGMAEVVCEYCD